MAYWLGVDCGTSGLRCCVINEALNAIFESSYLFSRKQASEVWRQALFAALAAVPALLRTHLRGIAIDATSGTVLLCNALGQPLRAPLMYNDTTAQAVLQDYLTHNPAIPADHVVRSAASAFAKALWLSQQSEGEQARYLLHQADWLAAQLHGRWGFSDYHNALKLGIDPQTCTYPPWFPEPLRLLVPQVVAPGTPIATLLPQVAQTLGIPSDCWVCAGTTDSLAAFIASGSRSRGEGVTSLGSTLSLKLLSDQPLSDRPTGIYSHRYGDLWLVGGASNTGGAVLAHFFSPAQLASLSTQIEPTRPSPYHYVPLLKPGERFPLNDPYLAPCLEPRPPEAAEFLHGLLESIARVEAAGYQRLRELGAPALTRVWSLGGGAQNPTWTAIRSRLLGVPVAAAQTRSAAYGAALLAYHQALPTGS